MKNLVQIAAKVRDRNKVLASVPGSGFHPNDLSSPEKRGLPSITTNVVFFHRKHDVLFVGEDAERVILELGKLYEQRKAEFDGKPVSDERKAVFVWEELEQGEQGGVYTITCPLSCWNDLVPALLMCGIGVSGAALDGSSVA